MTNEKTFFTKINSLKNTINITILPRPKKPKNGFKAYSSIPKSTCIIKLMPSPYITKLHYGLDTHKMRHAMRQLLLMSSLLMISCATTPQTITTSTLIKITQCQGDIVLPQQWQSIFSPVTRPGLVQQQLLTNALGKPAHGKLCQGQVFTVNAPATLYRAWNSTNPNSRLGSWWAMDAPTGAVAQYRKNYKICYQWSALDQLVQCQLQPGTQVVIGTGQSAECSQYLSYPASASLQVYIDDSHAAMSNCQDFIGVFDWQPASP